MKNLPDEVLNAPVRVHGKWPEPAAIKQWEELYPPASEEEKLARWAGWSKTLQNKAIAYLEAAGPDEEVGLYQLGELAMALWPKMEDVDTAALVVFNTHHAHHDKLDYVIRLAGDVISPEQLRDFLGDPANEPVDFAALTVVAHVFNEKPAITRKLTEAR
jgi:hypothetical protein